MNILQQIKSALYKIRRATPAKHKPTKVVPLPAKKQKPIKQVKQRELIKTIVNGRELSLGQIAKFYNIPPHTVYARYRVGNRGKLLIRPTPKQKLT